MDPSTLILFADDSPAPGAGIGDHARAGAAYALNAAASLRCGATDQAHRTHDAPGYWPPSFRWSPLDPVRDLGRSRDLIAQECAAAARRQPGAAAERPGALRHVLELRDALLTAERVGSDDAWRRVRLLASELPGRIAEALPRRGEQAEPRG